MRDLEAEPGLQLLVFGHSHVATLERGPNGGVYANAGTWLGDSTYLRVDNEAVELHRWRGALTDQLLARETPRASGRLAKGDRRAHADAPRGGLQAHLCRKIPELRRDEAIGAGEEVGEDQRGDPVLEVQPAGLDATAQLVGPRPVAVVERVRDDGQAGLRIEHRGAGLGIDLPLERDDVAHTLLGDTEVVGRLHGHRDVQGFDGEVQGPGGGSLEAGLRQPRQRERIEKGTSGGERRLEAVGRGPGERLPGR